MKTPSLLLLAALAAVPASAEIPARCDEAWLKAARTDVTTPGKLLTDPDGRTTKEGADVRLKRDHEQLCQSSLWRFLRVEKSWAEGNIVFQIDQLLAASALYAGIDPKAADVLDKAEAVLRAAESLGAVKIDTKGKAGDSLKTAVGLAFASRPVYEVTAVAAKDVSSKLTPEGFASTLQQLLVDVPVKDAEPKQALGPLVIAFRKSIGELNTQLSKGVASKAIPFDGLPFKAGEGDSWFQEEKGFRIIANQVGSAKVAKMDDIDSDPKSLLDPLDIGARNLIALRVAEVDRALESVRKQMDGKSVRAVLAASRMPSAYGANAPKAGTLAAEVARRLSGVKDYQDLDAMFEAKQGQPGYIADPAQRKAVADRLAQMRSDAAAAAVVDTPTGKRIEFSVGGEKRSVAVVGDLEKSAAYREQVTSYLADRLAQNPMDAKMQAALTSFRGVGEPGGNLSTVNREQADLAAGKLPKPPDPKIDPTTPFGKIASSKEASCGSPADLGKGSMERYSAKKRAALAAEAGANSRQRQALQKELDAKVAAIEDGCRKKEAAIMAAPRDPDDDDKADKAKRAQAVAKLHVSCDAEADAAQTAVLASAKDVLSSKAEGARTKKGQDQLDEELDAAFSDGIVQSVDELRKAYKEAGSSRRRAAETASGYTGSYYRADRVDVFFDTAFGGKNLEAAVKACKTKLKFEKGKTSGFDDPSADNLDKDSAEKDKANLEKVKACEVRKRLVESLRSYRDQVSVPGETVIAPGTAVKPVVPPQPKKKRSVDELLGNGK